jgi:hypothetical protein
MAPSLADNIETVQSEAVSPTGQLDAPERRKASRLSNKQLIEFARVRGLPSPLFDWVPRFNELPNEVISNILSFADFDVSHKYKKLSSSVARKVDQHRNLSHVFNAMAAVSSRLNSVVEKHCDVLLKKHAVNDTQVPRLSFRPYSTSRSDWLAFINEKCAFCYHDIKKSSVLLQPSPFNRNVLCCPTCEQMQWPNQILLEAAMVKYKLPAYFLLFPSPLWPPLQTGKKEGLPYEASRRLFMGPSTEEVGMRTSAAIYYLEDEVRALRDLVVSDPAKYVPMWMTELPECCKAITRESTVRAC